MELNQTLTMWIFLCPILMCSPLQYIPSLDIRAQECVQLFLEKKYCVAKGNVRLQQGETIVLCEKIEVFFNGSVPEKSTQIRCIVATGKVVVRRGSSELKADRCVFDEGTQIFLAQSNDTAGVKFFQHQRQVFVQAQQIQYHLGTHKGIAKGQPRLTHPRGWLHSDTIFFVFSNPSSAPLKSISQLDSFNKNTQLLAHAKGNVVLVYEDWKSTSKEALYDQSIGKICLIGAVTTEKGNQSFGMTENATLDLTKNRYSVKSSPLRRSILMIPVRQKFFLKGRKKE